MIAVTSNIFNPTHKSLKNGTLLLRLRSSQHKLYVMQDASGIVHLLTAEQMIDFERLR